MKTKYHGSRGERKFRGGKSHITLLALIAILVCVIGGSLAYISDHTDPVKNTFTPASVSCQIEEAVENGSKSSAKVKNTGNVPAYIRVAVVANTVDSEKKITGAADVSSHLSASGWTKVGDYYYYNGEVQPDALTGELLKSSISLEDIQVTILASAIQSTPADAVSEAWGMSYTNGSWTFSSN